MKWRLHNRGYFSTCGQYELRPTYNEGRFAWHGRHVESDKLIQSSTDREYVALCCARHADAPAREAS